MPFSKEETQDGSRSQGQLPRCGLYGTCGHTQEAGGVVRDGDMEKNKSGINANALVYPKTKNTTDHNSIKLLHKEDWIQKRNKTLPAVF